MRVLPIIISLFLSPAQAFTGSDLYPVASPSTQVSAKMSNIIQDLATDYPQERALSMLVNTYEFILGINLHNPQELQQAASLTVLSNLCVSNTFRDVNEAVKATDAIKKEVLDTFKKRIHFGSFEAMFENNITQLPDYSSCVNV